MSQTRNKAVSEGDGPVFRDKYECGKPIMVEHFRVLREGFDRRDGHFDKMDSQFDITDNHFEEMMEKMSKINHRLDGLQLQVQQPRLAANAGGKKYRDSRA